MARVFAHKPGLYSPQEDEFGWNESSNVTEVSPASLWALDDEIPLRPNPNIGALSEENATDEPDLFAPELVDAGSTADFEATFDHDRELEWWSRPDIIEEPEGPSEFLDSSSSGFVQEEPFAVANEVTGGAALNRDEFLSTGEKDDAHSQSEPVEHKPVEHSPVAILPEPEIALDDPEITIDAPIPPEVLAAAASQLSVAVDETIASRPNVLDESVRSNEAAFATAVLNRQRPISRPRILDESAVLPHEASFATVSLYQRSNAAYSPSREIVSKFVYEGRRLTPVLAILVACIAGVFIGLKFRSSWLNFHSDNKGDSVANAPQHLTAPPANQLHGAIKAKPNLSPAKVTEIVKPMSEPNVSTENEAISQPEKSSAKNGRALTHDQSDKSIRSARPGLAVTRHPVAAPKARAGTSAGKKSAEKRLVVTSRTEGTKQSQAETSAIPSGGGERPRRVRQQTDSHASSAKPKVIDWP